MITRWIAWIQASVRPPSVPVGSRWARRAGRIDGARWRVFGAAPTGDFGAPDLEPRHTDWLTLPCVTPFRALRRQGPADVVTGDPAFDARVELSWDTGVAARLGPDERSLIADWIHDGGEITGYELAIRLFVPTDAAIEAAALRAARLARRLTRLTPRPRAERLGDPCVGAALLAATEIGPLTERERRALVPRLDAATAALPTIALPLVARWARPGEVDPEPIVALLSDLALQSMAVDALAAIGDARHVPALDRLPRGGLLPGAHPVETAIARIQARLGPERAGELSLGGDIGAVSVADG